MAPYPNNVVSLFSRSRQTVRDWTQSERAQFYRVEAVLIQAGMAVEQACGLTDEGDPWFAFYHGETGDVFVHFARIDGLYIVESPAMRQPLTDTHFTRLVSRLAEDHPLLLAETRADRNNVTRLYMHPTALLFSAVAVLFFKTQPSEAAEADSHAGGQRGSDSAARSANVSTYVLNEMQTVALIGGLMALPLLSSDFFEPTPTETAGPVDSVAESRTVELAALETDRSNDGIFTDSNAGIQGDASDMLLQAGPQQFQSLDGALPEQRTVDVEAPNPEQGKAVAETEPHEPIMNLAQQAIEAVEAQARGGEWITVGTANTVSRSSEGTGAVQEQTVAASTPGPSEKGTTGSSSADKMSDAENVLLAAGILDDGDSGRESLPAAKPEEDSDVDTVTITPTQIDADGRSSFSFNATIDLLIQFTEVAGDYFRYKDAAADVVFIYDSDVELDYQYDEGTVFHHAIDFDDGSRVELVGFNDDFRHLDLNVA